MNIISAVRKSEQVMWETVDPYRIPLGVRRVGSGDVGFDPVTMAPIVANDTIEVFTGVETNYSSEELRSLKDILEIGYKSRKVLIESESFVPTTGDVVLLWNVPIRRGYTVSGLVPPADLPRSTSLQLWVCLNDGTVGGSESVSQGVLLYAPNGSEGGTFAEVGSDWQFLTPISEADIVNVRNFGNLNLKTKILDIRTQG